MRQLLRLRQVNVLFVCVGNSGRSVMAERLFRQAAAGRHASRSAGPDPHGSGAEPAVVEALREVGIDASDHVQHRLEDDDLALGGHRDRRLRRRLPGRHGEALRELGISDPYGLPVERVRPIRDEIAHRVDGLLAGF